MSQSRFTICLLLALSIGCAGPHAILLTSNLEADNIEDSHVFSLGHSGYIFMDLDTKEILDMYNAEKYFIPASNTKILTLAGCMTFFDQGLPVGRILESDSQFVFTSYGDPSFLHKDFSDQSFFNLLLAVDSTKKIFYADVFNEDPPLGKGWMWDDFNESYQIEKSPLMTYGGIIEIYKNTMGWHTIPPLYNKHVFISPARPTVKRQKQTIMRALHDNLFFVPSGCDTLDYFYQSIPIYNLFGEAKRLLSDTLKRSLNFSDRYLHANNSHIFYNTSLDTILKKMMYDSDNMIAEQLLLCLSGALYDTLSTERSIDTISRVLYGNNYQIKWVDGSGLSRYNLMTPSHIVQSLSYLDEKWGTSVWYKFFSPIHHSFQNDQKPLRENKIWAKSGSMSGVYNLSGIIETSKGKRIAFSWMNNNIHLPVKKIKAATIRQIERRISKY